MRTWYAHWTRKFACALRGIPVGMRRQSSFLVHQVAAIAVLCLGTWLGVSPQEWCLLILCITLVLSLELINSSLERLAHSVTREYHSEIRDALDTASGAVLVTAIGAAIVGSIVFLPRLFRVWQL